MNTLGSRLLPGAASLGKEGERETAEIADVHLVNGYWLLFGQGLRAHAVSARYADQRFRWFVKTATGGESSSVETKPAL